MTQDYEKLKVWQEAHALVIQVAQLVKNFPATERFALTPQLWRAAVSIPGNIAEGSGRGSQKDFRKFLFIALGSVKETSYYLRLANDLQYIENNAFLISQGQTNKVMAMLISLIGKIDIKADTSSFKPQTSNS